MNNPLGIIITIITFFLPSYQFLRPIPNHILLFVPFGFLSLYFVLKSRNLFKVLFTFLILCFAFLLSEFSLPGVGLVLAFFVFYCASTYPVKPLILSNIVVGSLLFNFLFSVAQYFFPTLGISNINIYDISSHSLSSFYDFLSIFSVGRLRGIYNENGPMVTYLTVQTAYLILYSRLSLWKKTYLNIDFCSVSFENRPLAIFRPSFTLETLSVICSLLLIIFTGSKVIFWAIPFLSWISFNPFSISSYHRSYRLRQTIQPYLSFFLPCILLAFFYMAYFSSASFISAYNLDTVISSTGRFNTDFGISLFQGIGLLPSSSGEALSLSAYVIYSLAYGFVVSFLLLFSYLLFFSQTPFRFIFLLLSLFSFTSSGSLLIPLYVQLLLMAHSLCYLYPFALYNNFIIALSREPTCYP